MEERILEDAPIVRENDRIMTEDERKHHRAGEVVEGFEHIIIASHAEAKLIRRQHRRIAAMELLILFLAIVGILVSIGLVATLAGRWTGYR